MPNTARGKGAIESDKFGNHVAELASGRNSYGGGRCFAEFESDNDVLYVEEHDSAVQQVSL